MGSGGGQGHLATRLAKRGDGIAYRFPDADREHEGRLPNRFAAVNDPGLRSLGKQVHVESCGRLANRWNLLGAGRVGQ